MSFAGRLEKGRTPIWAILIAILFSVLAVCGTAAAEQAEIGDAGSQTLGGEALDQANLTIHIGDRTKWDGVLSNLSVQFDPSIQRKDGWDWSRPTTWGFSIPLKFTITGDFEIDIREAGTFREKFFDFNIDMQLGLAMQLAFYSDVSSTVPARLKGTFSESYTYNWNLPPDPSILVKHESDFQFTSIQPAASVSGGTPIKVYVGTDAAVVANGLYVKYLLEPVINGGFEFKGGGWAEGTLAKDQWEYMDGNYVDDGMDAVHTCALKGMAGCLDGHTWKTNESKFSYWFQLVSPVFGTIIPKTQIIGTADPPRTWDDRHFVQSLSWEEEIKYQAQCEHIFYKVPVAVWANPEKTIPVDGIFVQVREGTDRAAFQNLTWGKSGANTTIRPKTGRANLYLPYKENTRYLVEVDPAKNDPEYAGMTGSARQPTAIRREKNDQVDIILGSAEKVTLNIEKKWDIDLEGKDRPENIEVMIQRSDSGNGVTWENLQKVTLTAGDAWKTTLQVDKSYIDREGRVHKAAYRVREMSEDTGTTDEERIAEKAVTYHVSEYTTGQGEHVSAHETKYQIAYAKQAEGDTITYTITNTAMMEFDIQKVWKMYGKAETPEHVWLAFCYRPNVKYAQLIPDGPMKRLVSTWIPVWKPLGGDKANLLSVLDLDFIMKRDPTGITRSLKVPFAIGKTSKEKEWKLHFSVKKYGWMGIDGIPVEFQAQEVSALVIKDVIQFLTGIDIPISPSVNPFSGKVYASTAGYPIQIPLLHRDWQRGAWILNVWKKSEDETAIGGTKHWVNDRAEDRPEAIFIHVHEPQTGEEICDPIRVTKADGKGDIWFWSLKSSEVRETYREDFKSGLLSYRISESYPEGYSGQYSCEISGYNLINTWGKRARIVIRKQFIPASGVQRPGEIRITLADEKGEVIGEWSLPESNEIVLVDGTDFTLGGRDIHGFRLTEDMTQPSGCTWVSQVSGPERDDSDPQYTTYLFTITNRPQQNVVFKLRKEWVGYRQANVRILVRRSSPGAGTETIAEVLLEPGNSWAATVEKDPEGYTLKRYTPDGEEYTYTATEKLTPTMTSYKRETFDTVTETTLQITHDVLFRNTLTGSAIITGTKHWDDDGPEGRPGWVRVRVMTEDGPAISPDGGYYEKYVEPDGTYEIEGLPYEDEAGHIIPYHVIEFTESGYTTSYATPVLDQGNKKWICDITNSKKAINIFVQKIWDDSEDEAGNRPESVTIRLKQTIGGTISEKEKITLNEENEWYHLFKLLPRQTEKGQTITYTITEDPVAAYTTAIEEHREEGETQPTAYTITNTVDASLIAIPVRKEWKQDGEISPSPRPESIIVSLYRKGGETAVQTLTLSAENEWKGAFAAPRRDEGGNVIEYIIREGEINSYKTTITPESISGDDTSHTGFTITNTYEMLLIPVQKVWVDGDSTGKRLSYTMFRMLQNNRAYKSYYANPSTSWKGVTRNPKNIARYDENGKPYIYTLTEEIPAPGYTLQTRPERIYGDDTSGTGFTAYNILQKKIIVRKIWVDEDDKYGNRPEKLYVTLMGNGEQVARDYLSRNLGWEHTFTVPAFRVDAEGKVTPITYSVQEDAVPGYRLTDTTVSGDQVTLTNTIEYTDVKVRKVWDDGEDKYQKRPTSVTVHLYGSGTKIADVELSAGNNWEYTWKLPKYRGGREVSYSITEDAVEYYTTLITHTEEGGYTITNRMAVKKDVTVQKEWGYSEERPAITVRLWSNANRSGEMKIEQTFQLTGGEEEPWTHVFRDLPTYYKDDLIVPLFWEIEYKVDEVRPEGFEEPQITRSRDTFTIFNWKMPTTTISGRKIWDDGDNRDGSRPDSITIYLKKDGETVASKTITARDGWAYSFDGIQIREKDAYTVDESYVQDYSKSIQKTDEGFDITNRYAPQTTSISVEKNWLDDDDQDGKRPERVTVRLKANGRDTGLVLTLSAENEWKGTFQNVPKREGGKLISYGVDEDPVEGYTTTYFVKSTTPLAYEITNRYDPETITVAGKKTWVVVTPGKATPESITVRLYADGEEVAGKSPITVSATSGWQYSFTDLPKYMDHGTAIVYTIDEDAVDGYDKVIVGYDITNTMQRTSIRIEKRWNDRGYEAYRPESVDVILRADGEFFRMVTIKKENEWKATVSDLPTHRHGQEITWSIMEKTDDRYQSTVSGSAAEGFVITNTPVTDIIVHKIWLDEGAEEDILWVYLYSNAEDAGDMRIVESTRLPVFGTKDAWTGIFDNLPIYTADGRKIHYEVQELVPYGYIEPFIRREDGDFQILFEIYNKKKDLTSGVYVGKDWIGTTVKPEKVVFDVYQDGVRLDRTIELTEENSWFGGIADLPAEDGGDHFYVYTVRERAVPGYRTKIIEFNPELEIEGLFVYLATNIDSHTVDIEGYKIWEDNDNEYGTRPEMVTVRLMARKGDGEPEEVDRKAVTAALGSDNGNIWPYSFYGYPEYDEGGQQIIYSVTETEVTGYTTAYAVPTFDRATGTWTTGITNTASTRELRIKKEWIEEGGDTRWRPESLQVHILADQRRIRTVTMTAEDGWMTTVGGLPTHDKGTKITYTIQEEVPEGYYSAQISGDAEEGFTLTNVLFYRNTDIKVSKYWMNADMDWPEITAILLSDRETEGEQKEVAQGIIREDSRGLWDYVFQDQPVYAADGREIQYSISEVIPENFGEPIISGEGYEFQITNWKPKQNTAVVFRKVWDDEEDIAKMRPKTASFELYQNGQPTGKTALIAEKTRWEDMFTGLEREDGEGNPYLYTIREVPVTPYETTIEEMPGSRASGIFIYQATNVLRNRLDISGRKIWKDEEEREKLRPESVTVILLADGVKKDSRTVTAKDNWRYTFEGLPKYAEGKEIVYTVDEDEVPYYSKSISGYDITNTLKNASYQIEAYYQKDGAYPKEPDEEEIVMAYAGERVTLSSEDKTPKREGYVLDESRDGAWSGVVAEDGSTVLKVYFRQVFVITYNPNGGLIDGSPDPVREEHGYGEVISIRKAPVRDGYWFRYWKGSEYQPGDEYLATDNHTFVAQWEREDPLYYQFTFTKKWSGKAGESISWTLYNPDGTVRHKKFNKTVISDNEWRYDAWFDNGADYYLIEEVPAGYRVRYENVGIHAGETDRCYNGGTIINYKLPKTGEGLPWGEILTFGGLAAFLGILLICVRHRKREKE